MLWNEDLPAEAVRAFDALTHFPGDIAQVMIGKLGNVVGIPNMVILPVVS